MPESDAFQGQRGAGLLGSLKALVATLIEVLQTRLQLFSNELEAEKLRIIRLGAFAAAALFFLAMGVLLLTLLVVVAFWDAHRLVSISVLAAAYVLLGVVFAARAVKCARTRSMLFEASLRELGKDRDRLSS